MKFLLQAAAFLSATAAAFAIPPSPHVSTKDKAAIAGSTVAGGVSVLFSVPCPGRFSNDVNELDFELKLDSSSLSCQSSAIVLNDVRLSPNPGSIQFRATSPSELNVNDVTGSWEMSCLNGVVTLLSLRITKIGGTVAEPGFGFTASFKQCEIPEILRLQSSPINESGDPARTQAWTQAQQDPEFVVVPIPATINEQLPNELQEQLRHLHEIKAQIARLHFRYIKQERHVFNMIKQDFHSCDGVACVLNTVLKKAPDFFELVKAHFRHHPDWSKLQGRPAPFEGIRKQGDHRIMYGGLESYDRFGDASSHPWDTSIPDHTPFPTPFDEPGPESLPPPPPPPSSPSVAGVPPHDHEHDHPLPPPWRQHHHRPHFFHRHGPHRHPFFFSTASILFFVVLASLSFKCLRAKTGLFRNQRRKRDRAARREECRNRAAYRRAAMTHRWHSWLSRFRQPEGTSDYEEKRARILDQEGALESVMQSEIRDLRRAHEMADDMIRAEETRRRMHHEANFGGSVQPTEMMHDVQRQSPESSRAAESAMMHYEPPPPSYDQELEGDMTVVDGFMYTPSATDSTYESSVVDCNSRMSFETNTVVTQ